MSKNQIKSIFMLLIFICIDSINAQTTIDKNNGRWELLVDGNLYEIKGVTIDFVNDIDNYDVHFKD